MKRYVAKMMKKSLGPRGADMYRGTSKEKKQAIGSVAKRKWKAELAKDGGYLPSERPVWCKTCESFHIPRPCAKPVTSPAVASEVEAP